MLASVDISNGAGPRAAYHLPSEAGRALLRDLVDEHPPASDGRFACYCISGGSRYSDVARTVECGVFQDFFGNGPDVMSEAYAPYERSSLFFLVIDCEAQEPSGCLRVLTFSTSGLKTLNDIAQPPLAMPVRTVMETHNIQDLALCWDVGTLAVLKKYRGRGHVVSTMLYGRFHAAARKAGIEHAVTILDAHAYRQLTENFAIPFTPIAQTRPFAYLGSENSCAAYMHIPAIIPAVESYMNALEPKVRQMLKPSLSRVIYAEGLPDLVSVS